MIRVDERVEVSTNSLGEPTGFRWRNIDYRVVSKPERWFSRKDWWVDQARAQRGIGAGILEVEMWRLSAIRDSGPAQFELIHTEQNNSWQLVRIFG